MMKPNLLKAARALLGWEQTDLAERAGLSTATIRKIEQGATGIRDATEKRIVSAFEQGGLRLIPEDADGGIGVRFKEREMDAQMQAYLDLKNQIKGWFVYNLNGQDGEALDDLIDTLAFDAMGPEANLEEHRKLKLPQPLISDLEKLGEMELELGVKQDVAMLDTARARGWDGDMDTLPSYFKSEGSQND